MIPFAKYDSRTRRVVERIESIGRDLDPGQLAGGDIVHADLHPGNLLQSSGQLAAVVDLAYTRTGDEAFDLVFLAVSSLAYPCDEPLRQHLMEIGLDVLDQPRRQAYIGTL